VAIEKCGIPVFAKAINTAFSLKGQGITATCFKTVQVLLVPSYAITDNKSHGRTLDRAVIDVASARGQGSYMMLSRTQTLKGILILRWFQTTEVTQRRPQELSELRNELTRLSKLDITTIEFYETNINQKVPIQPIATIEQESAEELCDEENKME
jgi:ATP-dependent DNA helicase PIF1